MSNSKNPHEEGDSLLKKVKENLKKEGKVKTVHKSAEEKFEIYHFPALNRFRPILKNLYDPFTYDSGNPLNKLKNTLLNKIGNVTRNVTEKSFMRQQKFNDAVYALLQDLYQENKLLKEKLEKLENHDKRNS